MRNSKTRIIVEARGGVIGAVYGNRRDIDVCVVDWDEPEGKQGFPFPLDSLASMPSETKAAARHAARVKRLRGSTTR